MKYTQWITSLYQIMHKMTIKVTHTVAPEITVLRMSKQLLREGTQYQADLAELKEIEPRSRKIQEARFHRIR